MINSTEDIGGKVYFRVQRFVKLNSEELAQMEAIKTDVKIFAVPEQKVDSMSRILTVTNVIYRFTYLVPVDKMDEFRDRIDSLVPDMQSIKANIQLEKERTEG